jgi:hypothetical protein
MKKELKPAEFVKAHSPAVSVMVKHTDNSHYVSSKHSDGHHFSASYDNHDEAEKVARELSGKPADGQPLETKSHFSNGKKQKSASSEEQGYAMPEIERQA